MSGKLNVIKKKSDNRHLSGLTEQANLNSGWSCVFSERFTPISSSTWLSLFSCSVVLDSCNPMDCSTPGSPVLHYLPELAQTHVH